MHGTIKSSHLHIECSIPVSELAGISIGCWENSFTDLRCLSIEPYQRFFLLIIFLLPLFYWTPMIPELRYCQALSFDLFAKRTTAYLTAFRCSLLCTIPQINSKSYLCLPSAFHRLLTIQWERFACSGFGFKRFLHKPLLAARARPAPNKITSCIKNLFIMQEDHNAASYYQLGNWNCAVWCLSWIFSFV